MIISKLDIGLLILVLILDVVIWYNAKEVLKSNNYEVNYLLNPIDDLKKLNHLKKNTKDENLKLKCNNIYHSIIAFNIALILFIFYFAVELL